MTPGYFVSLFLKRTVSSRSGVILVQAVMDLVFPVGGCGMDRQHGCF